MKVSDYVEVLCPSITVYSPSVNTDEEILDIRS